MPQQTSTFESHFLTHMQGVAGAYHKLIVCSWVPILQVGGLGKVRVNCFPKAITTWLGWESNPRPPDPESDALLCPLYSEPAIWPLAPDHRSNSSVFFFKEVTHQVSGSLIDIISRQKLGANIRV